MLWVIPRSMSVSAVLTAMVTGLMAGMPTSSVSLLSTMLNPMLMHPYVREQAPYSSLAFLPSLTIASKASSGLTRTSGTVKPMGCTEIYFRSPSRSWASNLLTGPLPVVSMENRGPIMEQKCLAVEPGGTTGILSISRRGATPGSPPQGMIAAW